MDWINCEFIGPPPKGYDSWTAYLTKSGDKLEGLIVKAKEPEFMPERLRIDKIEFFHGPEQEKKLWRKWMA